VATIDVKHLNVGIFSGKVTERSVRVSSFDIFHTSVPYQGIGPDVHRRISKTFVITPQPLQLPDAPLRLQVSPRFGGLPYWTHFRADLFMPRARFTEVPSLKSILRDDLMVNLLIQMLESKEQVRHAPRGAPVQKHCPFPYRGLGGRGSCEDPRTMVPVIAMFPLTPLPHALLPQTRSCNSVCVHLSPGRCSGTDLWCG
jgi:hypothetical protein